MRSGKRLARVCGKQLRPLAPGKTHLASGLCVAACRQRHRVRFTTATALIDQLTDQAHIITTGSDSYWFRRTTAQPAELNRASA